MSESGAINACMIPAPMWFEIVDLLLYYVPMIWLGNVLANRLGPIPVAGTDQPIRN